MNELRQDRGDQVGELLGGVQGDRRDKRGPDCLSHAALDRLALNEATEAEAGAANAHLATCARCRASAERLAQDRASFLAQENLPGLAADALARAGSRAEAGAGWRRFLPALGVVAVASAALLVVGPKMGERSAEEDDGAAVGVGAGAAETGGFARKGGGFGLGLYVLHRESAGTTGDLHTGEPLHPGDRIRLQLRSDQAGYALVLAVDAAAKVSVYHPQGSAATALAAGAGTALDQAVELDDTLGKETLIALRCSEALPVATAVTAARAHTTEGGTGPLGLPCTEARYVIEKVAP